MSKYTIELRHLHEDPNFEIFDFHYDFYDEELKANFQKKFINHYYFDEIGAETVSRWKHQLASRLNMIYPYYYQLYQTELKSKDIDFMLNKDLREEFERIVEAEEQSNSKSTANGTNNGDSKTHSKVSNLDNGVASVSMGRGDLTGESEDQSTTTNETKSNSTNQNEKTDKQTEKTILVSQGNIGTTSSAELLERWRDVLINIDRMIIDECKDLFMMIY